MLPGVGSGAGSGPWPGSSPGPDNSPAGRGLPQLPDLEPAGDGSRGSGDGAGSQPSRQPSAATGPRRGGSLAAGGPANVPSTGLEGPPGGIANGGAGLEDLPQVSPPQRLGNLLGRSGGEPIDLGRLQALNNLLGALPSGGGPRPAARSGTDAPSGPDLGSSPAASGASAGATASSLGSPSGAASTSTSTSSSSASGSPPPLGASGLVFGSDSAPTSSSGSNAASKGDGSFEGPRFTSRIKDGPTKTIEVPFPIVVVCEPDGVIIHPGGYRITARSLESRRADNLLVKELLAVARQRAATDPSIRPIPRVKFLVEGGGTDTFWEARKQILFSGLSWPMSLQVTGAQEPHLLGKETW
jgi:hypothetical protein